MGLFGRGKYQYEPGTLGYNASTEEQHIALPRDAAQRAEWEAAAGFPVAGRRMWVTGVPQYLSPEAMQGYVEVMQERVATGERFDYRYPEAGDGWDGEAGL